MELKLVGGVFAIFAAIFSAVRFYFVRKTVSSKGPFRIALISSLVGSLFFVPVSLVLNYGDFSGASKAGFFSFVVVGFGVAFWLYFTYEGVRRVGASRTSPITRGSMLIASLIAVLFLGESVGTLHLIGMIILFLGISLVSHETGGENSNSNSLISRDLAFPLTSMIIGGSNAIFVSLGYKEGVPITIGLSIQLLTSFVVMVLLFRYRGWSPLESFYAEERNLYVWAGIAFAAALTTWNTALSIAPVVVVQPLRGTGPLFVLIISYLYLKKLEKITKTLVFGVIITVLGAVLVGIFM